MVVNFQTRKLSCRKDDRAMRPIYGCPENSRVPEYAHGLSRNFQWTFVPIDPMNVLRPTFCKHIHRIARNKSPLKRGPYEYDLGLPMLQADGQIDRQTDRQTDDLQSQYRALHYSALCGKNLNKMPCCCRKYRYVSKFSAASHSFHCDSNTFN